MTQKTVRPNPNHPAKFSPEILAQLRAIVRAEAARLGRRPILLDQHAGVGRIHELFDIAETHGVELEPEWAACHARTIVGDACHLPDEWTSWVDIIATSPVYPNRMVDHHDAKDKCSVCKGSGRAVVGQCAKCKGSGLSPRKNYKTQLGRMPSIGSSAILGWGDPYRDFAKVMLGEADRVLDDGGLLVVNMSNHFKSMEQPDGSFVSIQQPVVEWYVNTIAAMGYFIEAVLPVRTSRSRHGANYDLRAKVEQILVMRKPPALDITP